MVRVELEGAFMSASVVHGDTSDVEATGHELNDIDLSGDAYSSWNDGSVGGDHGWQ